VKAMDRQASSQEGRGGERMPLLFVGHGNPMNAIEDNPFSRAWQQLGRTLPRPRAVLCISAHWETWGTLVTAMEKPRTIHDFGGFPAELYQVDYPAPGSPWLARETKEHAAGADVGYDEDWGLDHGCWSVLRRMFPAADVPIVQMSLDSTRTPQEHYALGRELSFLRRREVLIVGSGNLVHNLRRLVIPGGNFADFNRTFGLDWALEASDLFKRLIDEERYEELIDYRSLGPSVQLAVPTPEHFLPLLYVLASKEEDESVTYFNDQAVAGSLTMTSLLIR
jgi:4,5-DOPA dioxygenase extradiol